MLKITGLDKLTRELREAQAAIASIDGHLGEVRFDSEDPASIERAIGESEMLIDEKLGAYSNNPLVVRLRDSIKAALREKIIARAATARIAGTDRV